MVSMLQHGEKRKVRAVSQLKYDPESKLDMQQKVASAWVLTVYGSGEAFAGCDIEFSLAGVTRDTVTITDSELDR